MSNAKIVWYEPELKYFLNSPQGPVGRDLARRGTLVAAAAKRQVGVKTGRLQQSIRVTHERYIFGQQVKVGSDLHYALLHHNGTRPHTIVPSRAHMLVFVSRGRKIVTPIVHHPGTKPNRYLSDNLRLAII